jgi:hypothetical protein
MVAVTGFHNDPAPHDLFGEALETFRSLHDRAFHGLGMSHVSEADLQGQAHWGHLHSVWNKGVFRRLHPLSIFYAHCVIEWVNFW